MKVEMAPTTAEDVRTFFPKAAPWRIRALTVRVDGKIVGIGGYAILPDSNRIAFVEASEEDCRKYPLALHRAAKRFFKDIEAAGIRRFVASADYGREAAGRWLERLGFEPLGTVEGEKVYQWQRH